jgi:hypothetical protein
MNQDADHLRLLSIFHYVVGGLTALFACLPLFHLAIGIAIVTGAFPKQPGQQVPDMLFGWIFIIMATVMILLGWSLAIAIIIAGRYLTQRTHYTFCLVVAAVECIMMPFGTVLGIFSLIVLNRSSVKPLFDAGVAAAGSDSQEWR